MTGRLSGDAAMSVARAARNQSLYREINERIEALNEAFDEAAAIGGDWICECADPTCTTLLAAQVSEYEAVRANPRTFIVSPGHVYREVERVVERNERFEIVEKIGEAGDLAEETNPRAVPSK